jgi:hypothetical protein
LDFSFLSSAVLPDNIVVLYLLLFMMAGQAPREEEHGIFAGTPAAACSISAAILGREGYVVHKTFTTTKPCFVWVRLAENPSPMASTSSSLHHRIASCGDVV